MYFILEKVIYVSDLQGIDPELTKNILWIMDNSIEGEDIGFDFSYNLNILGEKI